MPAKNMIGGNRSRRSAISLKSIVCGPTSSRPIARSGCAPCPSNTAIAPSNESKTPFKLVGTRHVDELDLDFWRRLRATRPPLIVSSSRTPWRG